MSLLEVRNWRMGFENDSGITEVLKGINLRVDDGETVGLVGESGSGKSLTGLSVLDLLPRNAKHLGGEILFQGKKVSPDLRGEQISMIFQEPVASLNPAFTVEFQIAETLKIHQKLSGESLRERCLDLLKMVGISDPQARLKAYPHELSGGMAQRVMIAIAIACRPKILIADEPTTALDVTIQAQILNLLKRLKKETGLSILLISHDMGVIYQNCNRVYVMNQGEVVEEGDVDQVIHHPNHAYTQKLLSSLL